MFFKKNLLTRRAEALGQFSKALTKLRNVEKELSNAILETKEEINRLAKYQVALDAEAKATAWSSRKIEELLGQ